MDMEKYSGKSKHELDTPCLTLDIDIFEDNLALMRDFVTAAGKKLRPHVKTHKCSEIAKRQLAAGGCAGLCVAKVSEAAGLVDAGLTDILITSPVVTEQKISALLECAEAARVMTVIDNRDNADALNRAAGESCLKLKVLADINPAMGRTGVDCEEALELGKYIASLPNLELTGIQCYAGNLQHIGSFKQRQESSLLVMRRAAEVFRQFRQAGLNCEIFTGTGTGTFNIDSEIPEMTDFQVGSYCVMDAEYLQTGGSANPERFDLFKPALSLLASVISVNQPDFVTVDAGLKALYYTPHAPPMVLNQACRGWKYEWFGDEHGRVYFPEPGMKPALGGRIELSASHCDPTINLFDCMWIIKDGIVIDCWEIDLRGCCR
ncbi:MAG: DSD1 family PLP-dependent enzyme [Victivallaceae bacterium]|jgi:D-serine deaminase-like pyridoxal phosphate-dependent protein